MVVNDRLSDDEIARVRALVESRGTVATALQFKISPHALCRAIAGLNVRSATVTVIRISLATAA